MNRDKLLELAKEAGCLSGKHLTATDAIDVMSFTHESLERFAALLSQQEQEPVATVIVHNGAGECRVQSERLCPDLPIGMHSLYTAPPPAQGWNDADVREAVKAGFIAAAKRPQHLKTTKNVADSAERYADLHMQRTRPSQAQEQERIKPAGDRLPGAVAILVSAGESPEDAKRLIDETDEPLAFGAGDEQLAQALPERDKSKSAEEQGLFRKFDIRRVDGSDRPGGKHYGCRYYVIDIDHDENAPVAMQAYAAKCRTKHPQLADDIMRWLPAQATDDRIALALTALKVNHEYHQNCDEYDGYSESELCEQNTKVIATLSSAQYVAPEGWALERNEDGSITVSGPPGWCRVTGGKDRSILESHIFFRLLSAMVAAAPATQPQGDGK